jgi:hypothetical protein
LVESADPFGRLQVGPDQFALRRAARSRIWAAGGFGEALKSKPSKGGLLLELRSAQVWFKGDGLAAGDLVLAEDLEEVEVSEFAFLGLREAVVECFEHPGQSQGLERVARGGGHHTRIAAARARAGLNSQPVPPVQFLRSDFEGQLSRCGHVFGCGRRDIGVNGHLKVLLIGWKRHRGPCSIADVIATAATQSAPRRRCLDARPCGR